MVVECPRALAAQGKKLAVRVAEPDPEVVEARFRPVLGLARMRQGPRTTMSLGPGSLAHAVHLPARRCC